MQDSAEIITQEIKTITSLPASKCTGCGACVNSCPVNAIMMEEDPDGYLFPQIKKALCRKCGECGRNCPSFSPVKKNDENPKCYAVWADDEIRGESSSGGAFSLLAEYVLTNGGIVCGAAFDDSWQVKHILVNDRASLSALRGSKYVQSRTGTVFREIENLLKEERLVMFSGCPCQVAGLQSFLGKRYDNLITADIFCHSIASRGVWRKYLEERFLLVKPDVINFRDKEKSGWSCMQCTITVKGNKQATNEYTRGFHSALFARESCGGCQYSHLPRQGDFSIGDWWGIEKFDEALNDNKGTSLLLVNNNHKQKVVKYINRQAKLFEPVPLSFIGRNGHLNGQLKLHQKRSLFLTMLRQGVTFSRAQRAALDEKYDFGIVGFWYGLNYGSILTSYAMYKTIERLGFSAIHLNKPKNMWSSRFSQKDSMAIDFARKYANISQRESNYHLLNDQCNMFIVGADTVWDPVLVKDFLPFFFLDFADLDKKKISYASSFGRSEFKTDDEFLKQYCHYACNRFDSISVREESGVKLMNNEFGREAERVIDPVFLIDPEEYRSLSQDGSDIELPDQYVFSNILALSEPKITAYKKVVDAKGQPTVNFANANTPAEGMKNHPLDVVPESSVENWLKAIDNASFVVSDSFHVTCFSILFQKDFITILPSQGPLVGRFQTLLTLLGLEERIVFLDETDRIEDLLNTHINYSKCLKVLKKEKKRSLKWLEDAITAAPLKHDLESKRIDSIITTFRNNLEEARSASRPISELNRRNDNDILPSAKDHLLSSAILRWAFRAEYWRCRLFLRLLPQNKHGFYHARKRALKIAIEILFHKHQKDQT